MGFPKQIKKTIPLIEKKILTPRRHEIADMISDDGTYLPKSLLHADLDRGFLDFVKDELRCVVEGSVIPTVDIMITTQNWSQFIETWDFQNIDKNAEPPFLTVVRTPEVKFGTNPAILYNIPNRKLYFYAQVPTWDGQGQGFDIYRIPQPVPVDITYSVKIICNRMRELNQFNKIVIEKFASRQAYTVVKGHYIPIVMGDISDESVMDIEKRKFYIQSYSFTLLGFLIDEDEFEVSPAINRVLQVVEVDERTTKRQKSNDVEKNTLLDVIFITGNTIVNQVFNYTTDLIVQDTRNIDSYDVYLNDNYYGSNLNKLQINTNDVLKLEVVKTNPSLESIITLLSKII